MLIYKRYICWFLIFLKQGPENLKIDFKVNDPKHNIQMLSHRHYCIAPKGSEQNERAAYNWKGQIMLLCNIIE